MDVVTILWSLSAAIAAVLAVVCGALWLTERHDRAALALCVLGIAAAIASYIELAMMRATSAIEYGEWLRWYHLPTFFAVVSLALFVHHFLGTGRSWAIQVFIASRVVVLIVNFSASLNANFLSLELLNIPFLGQQISVVGSPTINPWQWFALSTMVLLVYYLVDAVVQCWRRGGTESRRKALAVTIGVVVPLTVTAVVSQSMVFGLLTIPILNIPWFLGALVTMAYELAREVILSRRARLELAELRSRMAQLDRVSMLSQLSSTLAHELSQPLTAVLANTDAAMTLVKRNECTREELEPILGDIAAVSQRAADLIDRMRQMFKRHAIEMQPLEVGEVMRDVVLGAA